MYIKSSNNGEWKDFRDRPLIFLDCEMTGLDPVRHEIVEIAWKVVNGRTFRQIAEYSAKVRPEHLDTADPEALKISGYSKTQWKKAVSLKTALEKLAKVAPGGNITGWRVYVDWQFLERGFEKYKIFPEFDYAILDLASLAYGKVWKNKEVKNISIRRYIPQVYGIKVNDKHQAKEDVEVMYKVFKRMMKTD